MLVATPATPAGYKRKSALFVPDREAIQCMPTGMGGCPRRTQSVAGGGGAVFNPATLALPGWWRANYTGAPWVANASAGASGSNGALTTNGSDPTTGTAQNGKTPAAFNGTSNELINATDASTLYSTTAGSIVALFFAAGAAAPTGNIYDDAAIIVDTNADFGITYSTNGLQGFAFDGVLKSKVVACATGAYHLIMMRVDGVNLGMTLDSAAEVTQACSTLTVLTGTQQVGFGYLAGKFFNGRLLELMTSKVKLSNTDYANIKSYVNTTYSLAL